MLAVIVFAPCAGIITDHRTQAVTIAAPGSQADIRKGRQPQVTDKAKKQAFQILDRGRPFEVIQKCLKASCIPLSRPNPSACPSHEQNFTPVSPRQGYEGIFFSSMTQPPPRPSPPVTLVQAFSPTVVDSQFCAAAHTPLFKALPALFSGNPRWWDESPSSGNDRSLSAGGDRTTWPHLCNHRPRRADRTAGTGATGLSGSNRKQSAPDAKTVLPRHPGAVREEHTGCTLDWMSFFC